MVYLCHKFKTVVLIRSDQSSSQDGAIIIPVLEHLSGHKQLIQEIIEGDSIQKLLHNNVSYNNLYDATKYLATERMSLFYSYMFIPVDTVERIYTRDDGTCGFDAIAKSIGNSLDSTIYSSIIIFSSQIQTQKMFSKRC